MTGGTAGSVASAAATTTTSVGTTTGYVYFTGLQDDVNDWLDGTEVNRGWLLTGSGT
ncbi:MAG: hypothetical protein R3B07_26120 [Polyangiaceae bacterium]